MSENRYTIDDYVKDLRAITAEETDERSIVARVQPLAKRLANAPDWMTPTYWNCDEKQGFGVHLLHEEQDHSLAVFVMSWLPNRGTLAHNHKTWAVVVGLHGHEQETEWERLDDGSTPGFAKLRKAGERVMTAGEVAACMPDDIHAVWNVGEGRSMSLHTYGRHINFTGRSEFDPERNEERPLIVTVE